eukprot:Opistho-2@30195
MALDEDAAELLGGGDVESIRRIGRCEQVVGVLNRLLYSRLYSYYFAVIVLLSILTVIWTAMKPFPGSPGFLLIEIFVNCAMVFEVIVRVVAMGPSLFFSTWSARFDVLVAALSCVALVTYCMNYNNEIGVVDTKEEVMILAVLSVAQITRLGIMIINQHRRRMVASRVVTFDRFRRSRSTDGIELGSSQMALTSTYETDDD